MNKVSQKEFNAEARKLFKKMTITQIQEDEEVEIINEKETLRTAKVTVVLTGFFYVRIKGE